MLAKNVYRLCEVCFWNIVFYIWDLGIVEVIKKRKSNWKPYPKEFLEESSNVLFFDKDDETSLYHMLTAILDEKEIYQEDNYLQQFNWNAVVDKYIEVYENVIEGD